MEQQKIGEFIAKLRKEKEMTQQELAKKIGVTDKAISKWENGRCLMDIAMLKPLSKALDISILELMNGERIQEEDIHSKSNETIGKTLDYTNNKIRKFKKKIIIIGLLFTLLIIIFGGINLYKDLMAVYIYSFGIEDGYYWDDNEVYMEKLYNYEFFEKELSLDKKIEIKVKKMLDDEYFKIDNIKVRNDFKEYEKKGNSLLYESGEVFKVISFWEEESGDGLVSSFKENDFERDYIVENFYLFGSLNVENFEITKYLKTNITDKDKEKFLKKNNINNDIDFLKFIGKNYRYYLEEDFNMNHNYKIEKMKEIYMFNEFIRQGICFFDEVYLITGDYDGYMISGKYEEQQNSISARIYRGDRVYRIHYFTNEAQENSIEYINDLLSTLVIE